MIKEKSRITQGQLMFLILQIQVGVGILSLPYRVQAVAKGGGWISTLIAGIVAQVLILILWAICRRYPSDTLFTFLPKIAGKFFGKLLGFGYIFHFLFIAGIILILFTDIVGKWILMDTPRWALLLLMIATGVYLAKESIRVIARLFVSVSFFIIVMVLLTMAGYTNVNFTYLFPITEAGWPNILKGSSEVLISLVGFEVLLVAYPYVEGNSAGKLKAASLANMLTTLFYAFEVFTCLIIFSPAEFPLISEPLMYMLRSFSIQIVERIDLFFLSIWVIIVATSFVGYLYLASTGLGYFFHRGEHKKAVYYAAFVCFILAMIPQDQKTVELMNQIATISAYTFAAGIPFILLVIAYFSRKRRMEER
ncbi:spore germination protein (amino acid permease) [Thermoflavimicrobium dichotomicum]|uniref:Spore germination protein (Amino acid permease) n=2 Tax=Thermoflavimicrobium dichotomicum TaxID=46223 RepID=A0A1I3KJM0_9BACL|nr:spore germination protein (amino acid permease) [Thermoflavimicrobium dichotomicum]